MSRQVTSGSLIYGELKSDFSFGRRARFYRLAPHGHDLERFKMDDVNVDNMIQVETERAWHGCYLKLKKYYMYR